MKITAPVLAFLLTVAAAQVALAAPSGWLALDGNIRFNTLSGANVDWANSGTGLPTYVCPAGAVNLPGPGGLFNCGIPGAASTPPTAPTRTPAAAADPSIISADFIVDPVSGDTTTCGSGDPTTLSSGSNGDPITSYTVGTGPVADKSDLSNVYAVSHTRADNGHPELYFAAERLVNNGDSHIDFEFLQSQIVLSAACNGTLSGHRTEGDLLVAVDFTNGGGLAGTSVYQWHCVAEPGPQPADGTVCDPAAGPNPPQHYELIGVPASLTFLVNAADVLCGGWVCRDSAGNPTATVATNEFLEGGIDLLGLPFTGCFNSFLPHTRTSAPFTVPLLDFAGPVALRSCRDPAITTNSAPGQTTVAPGTAASDSIVVGNGGAGPVPTGSVTFFLCAPGQTTAGGCPSGGTQVGAVKTLSAGTATSDPTSATSAPGTYCWRTEYAPDSASTGVFAPATHTNATSECFGVAAVPGLPNTGIPSVPDAAAVPLGGFIALVAMPLALAMRRSRGFAILAIAALAAASVPDVAPTNSPASPVSSSQPLNPDLAVKAAKIDPSVALAQGAAMNAHPGWRLVIASIGVDALIRPVGLDGQHAMSSPASLDTVGWYDKGPLPGQAGDAVLDGHLGLAWMPAVFRDLHKLRPGDTFEVIWPDGHKVHFRVVSSMRVAAGAPAPPELFARSGPSRASLITCAGVWDKTTATFSERLIVTAVPA